MHLLLTGSLPFDGNNDDDVKSKITQGEIDFDSMAHVSGEAKELLYLILTNNYEMRITAADALNHQWFQNASKQSFKQEVMDSVLDNLDYMRSLHLLQNCLHTLKDQ